MTLSTARADRLRSLWARDFGLVALLNAVCFIRVPSDHTGAVAALVSSTSVAVFAGVHLLWHLGRNEERDEQLYAFERALEKYTLFLGFLPWTIAVVFFR